MQLEGEAVLSILERVRDDRWQLIGSEVIEAEIARLANPDKLASIMSLMALVSDRVVLDDAASERVQSLEALGFGLYDAFHIACAEKSQADIFLTTDDRLLKRGMRYNRDIQVPLSNPVSWLMTVLTAEGGSKNVAN